MASLTAAQLPVLVLNLGASDVADPASATVDRRVQIMVPASRRPEALEILELMAWRYSWVRRGLLRLAPMAYYWFDGGMEVELSWALTAAPLPPRFLRRLTRELWASAARQPDGSMRPDPATRLVELAVRMARPVQGQDRDWARFVALLGELAGPAEPRRIAREVRVRPAFDRAVLATERWIDPPGPGPLFDGLSGLAWRGALRIQRSARPRRLRRLLAAGPMLGDAPIRCRVGGVETIADAGVFVPTPDAELIAEMALERIRPVGRPLVVEIGAGNGAIALAIAAGRPESEIHGTDLSQHAVACASRNARRLGTASVLFHCGSLADPLPETLRGRVDLIVANLPFYPPSGYAAIGSVPRETIQGGGDDGLSLVRELARDATTLLRGGGSLLLQMFAWQWDMFAPELEALGYEPGEPRRTGPFALCPAVIASRRGERDRGRAPRAER